MKIVTRRLRIFALLLLTLLAIFPAFAKDNHGNMVIADRASGTISVIDVKTDTVTRTIALPTADNPSQPMYVVHSPRADRVSAPKPSIWSRIRVRGTNRQLDLDALLLRSSPAF